MKQHTQQTPWLLIMSFVALLLRFALFGYVRDIQVFQILFWVDLVLCGGYIVLQLPLIRSLRSSHAHSLAQIDLGTAITTSYQHTQKFFSKNVLIISRYIVPLMGVWLLWIVIGMVLSHTIPQTLRLVLAVLGGALWYGRSDIRRHGLHLGQLRITGYEISLCVGVLVGALLIHRYFFLDSHWMILASALGGWLVYLIGSYLSGQHISHLKTYLSFWLMSGAVLVAFLRQGGGLLVDWLDDRVVERVVYQEKIIYVPEVVDDYTDLGSDLASDSVDTGLQPQAPQAPQEPQEQLLDTRTQIDVLDVPSSSPGDILDVLDESQGSSIARRVLDLVDIEQGEDGDTIDALDSATDGSAATTQSIDPTSLNFLIDDV